MPDTIAHRTIIIDDTPTTTNNGQTATGRGVSLAITADTDHVYIEISAPALTVASGQIEAFYRGSSWASAGVQDALGAASGLVQTVNALAGGTLRYIYRPVAGVTQIAFNVTSRTAGAITCVMIRRRKV